MYKHGEELNTIYDKETEYKTSMRGLKVRGVYESYKEAEVRAKSLQRRDRAFHVYVGTVGAWLPWDPEADKVQNEEYLEDELNTLIKEYKKNQVHKDMLYEQERQDRKNDDIKKTIAKEELEKQEADNKKSMATIEDNLELDDPWLQRQNAIEPTEAPTLVSTEEPNVVRDKAPNDDTPTKGPTKDSA